MPRAFSAPRTASHWPKWPPTRSAPLPCGERRLQRGPAGALPGRLQGARGWKARAEKISMKVRPKLSATSRADAAALVGGHFREDQPQIAVDAAAQVGDQCHAAREAARSRRRAGRARAARGRRRASRPAGGRRESRGAGGVRRAIGQIRASEAAEAQPEQQHGGEAAGGGADEEPGFGERRGKASVSAAAAPSRTRRRERSRAWCPSCRRGRGWPGRAPPGRRRTPSRRRGWR